MIPNFLVLDLLGKYQLLKNVLSHGSTWFFNYLISRSLSRTTQTRKHLFTYSVDQSVNNWAYYSSDYHLFTVAGLHRNSQARKPMCIVIMCLGFPSMR
jgi:hypothetical protein